MVYGVAVAPDGRTLAAAHLRDGVRVWDVTTGQETAYATPNARGPDEPIFTPDGSGMSANGPLLACLGDGQMSASQSRAD